ncbi:winged helix-turn-helix domain-containing protein [Mesorhizobium sp.]|uniref:ATP-binding protein n=2 Tax=Mesorhizobium TaxID=68287 RepID=UPI0025FE84AF|nr:winged helix-turn-helix domain-containing protein [Mesorhizobium sp.]
MPSDSEYRFGAFELLVRRQLLMHAGTPVRVGSRAIAILTALVAAAGDIVTKQELIAAAWPTTFVDDSNLKVNVASLRRALEMIDRGQDYIATVPGRGYRFIAPVHRISIGTVGLPAKIRLIGRVDESRDVPERLTRNSVVTVSGTGGIGKTALATNVAHAVAAQFPDGVMFVDLAQISDPQLIPAALALALGLATGGSEPLAGIIHALEGQRRLLLIDNCEHLLPAAASVIDRLSANLECLRILATSREPLRIRGECVYRLGPLKTDPRSNPTLSEAMAYPAVELFVTRVSSQTGNELQDADAPSVAEICRRLDGIPLAIELAATRIGATTPARLLEMLPGRFEVLAYGCRKTPARQQTLQATLDWGYRLLSDREAVFVRALSVFAGAFDLEGAVALSPRGTLPETAMDILSSLAAKSFVETDWRDCGVTYRLLATTRAYLVERLRFDGEDKEARHSHAAFMCALLERGVDPAAAVAIQERREKFERCLNDVRSALAWTLGSGEDVALGVRLAFASLPLWRDLSLLGECRDILGRALARLDAIPLPDQRLSARLQLGLAIAGGWASEDDRSHRRALESALQAAQTTDPDLLSQVLSCAA